MATTDRRRQSPIADRRSTLGVPGVDDRLDVGRSSESPAAESSARTPASAASAAWPLTWESGIGNREWGIGNRESGPDQATGSLPRREVDRARRKKVFSHVSFVSLTSCYLRSSMGRVRFNSLGVGWRPAPSVHFKQARSSHSCKTNSREENTNVEAAVAVVEVEGATSAAAAGAVAVVAVVVAILTGKGTSQGDAVSTRRFLAHRCWLLADRAGKLGPLRSLRTKTSSGITRRRIFAPRRNGPSCSSTLDRPHAGPSNRPPARPRLLTPPSSFRDRHAPTGT